MQDAQYKTFTDPELVSLCLKGDGQAWEALIMRYRRLIYSIPVRFGFSSADAADVFQSVCVKLIENLHTLKDESKVSAWLITTATRRCIHAKALKYRDVGSEDGLEEFPDRWENLEDVRIQTEMQQSVREAIDKLPSRCQQLIRMLYFDSQNPSYEEIGSALSMPVSSVGPNRARCLEKLRVLLRRHGIK